MIKRLLPGLLLFLLFACRSNTKTGFEIPINAFEKPIENPIFRADSNFKFFDPIKKDSVRWQRADVFNPAAVVKDGKIFVLFRAEDNPAAHLGGRTSRIGLAQSIDGIHFTTYSEPVLFPENDDFMEYDYPGGCEDPRVCQTPDGSFVMLYTSWNYKTPRLSVAFSKDLKTWEKKGPAFSKAYQGKFKDMASKSGSVITNIINGNIVAAKINGKFWMYWGEHLVNLAWSENLYDWYPEMDKNGELVGLIAPRDGFFDSNLTECGPPALITDAGISLLYNGKNNDDSTKADPDLPVGTYSVGRVVFDPKDLKTVVTRSDKPFLKPSLPHEISGQYKAGTTFSEGLVFFKNKWFLYYGTADSFVGVAVAE